MSNQLSFLFNKLFRGRRIRKEKQGWCQYFRFLRLVAVKASFFFAFLFKKSTRYAWTWFFVPRLAKTGFNSHTTQKIQFWHHPCFSLLTLLPRLVTVYHQLHGCGYISGRNSIRSCRRILSRIWMWGFRRQVLSFRILHICASARRASRVVPDFVVPDYP